MRWCQQVVVNGVVTTMTDASDATQQEVVSPGADTVTFVYPVSE